MTKHILYGDILIKNKTKGNNDLNEVKYTNVKPAENEGLSEIATSLFPQLIKDDTNEGNVISESGSRRHKIIR